jgi:hypothetical protein
LSDHLNVLKRVSSLVPVSMATLQVLPVNGFRENVFFEQELNFLREVEDLSWRVEKV